MNSEPVNVSSTARTESSQRLTSDGPEVGSEEWGPEDLILTPSRLRLDSRVFFAHGTCHWLTKAFFCLYVLFKLTKGKEVSWWAIFTPLWLGHIMYVPVQLWVMVHSDELVLQQIGPPPPATASSGIHMQYNYLKESRKRTTTIDALCNLFFEIGFIMFEVLLCGVLMNGDYKDPDFKWEIVFSPIWISWGLSAVFSMTKYPTERSLGSLRDLLFIFTIFLAAKLNDLVGFSWKVVFLVPWVFYGLSTILTLVIIFLVLCVRVWRTLWDLWMPLGFLGLLLSLQPQMVSCIYLVRMLDGDTRATVQQVLLPLAGSLLLMWASSVAIYCGLRSKEQMRADLITRGRVWTHHERAARTLTQERMELVRRIDQMTEEEVSQLVIQMMAGKVKPTHLVRVGSMLYRTLNGTEKEAEEPCTVALVSMRPNRTTSDKHGDQSASGAGTRCPASLLPPPPPTNENSKLGAGQGAATSTSPDGLVGVDILSTDPSSSSYNPYGGESSALPPPARGPSAAGRLNSWAGVCSLADLEATAVIELPCRAASSSSSAGETLCTICYDQSATHVLLNCGHGGYCRRCANLMFVRPPHECPHCRQRVEQVVQVQERGKVGVPVQVAP